MPRKSGRTQDCGMREARERLRQAKSYLEVAEMAGGTESVDLEYGGVAASVAILGGIAAGDAACCAVLRRRSRSDDHQDAARLLAEITPGGKKAAAAMRQLIGLKDTAHYGFLSVTKKELKQAVRQASYLTEFAEQVLLRAAR
jgi:hypothetical protein